MVSAIASIALLSSGSICAQQLLLDDFEQFAGGTDLTATTYSAVAGAVETSVQNGSPTITVTNALGSKWAFFDNSTPPLNKNQYKARLTQTLTNRVLFVSWKMWIEKTNSGPGMFLLSVPVNDANPSITFNPPLGFLDTGSIVALTNGAPPLLKIGEWGPGAGTIMTNELLLDYRNREFTYSLNGQELAKLPLGTYFTNVVGAIYFNGFERSAGSLGNRFALDDIRVELRPAKLDITWTDSAPHLKVTGDPELRFALEYTSTLAADGGWVVLATSTMTSEPFEMSDGNHAVDQTRFYRARSLQ